MPKHRVVEICLEDLDPEETVLRVHTADEVFHIVFPDGRMVGTTIGAIVTSRFGSVPARLFGEGRKIWWRVIGEPEFSPLCQAQESFIFLDRDLVSRIRLSVMPFYCV